MLYATTISVSRQGAAETRINTDTDADQSCAQCGMKGIQLVPLQQEVCAGLQTICD